MPIVDTSVPITAASCDKMILDIVARYPFCRTELLTQTAFQRPVRTLVIGNGPRKVIYSAAHHANEWITSYVLLKFAEELAEAIQTGGQIFNTSAAAIRDAATIYMVPMVDPDGVDLVVGALQPGDIQYDLAQRLARDYPTIPFPDGWKANLLGVDLNLNYPAGWLQAREIKFSQGFTMPGPRDYVGRAPLNQFETRALAGYTEYIDPALVLAYHSQGKEIYWSFQDTFVEGARELGEQFAQVSGYTLTEPAFNSSFAGYKDWFIQNFRKPGYTVEVGRGVNPLPLSQFEEIYRDNLGILVLAATGGASVTE
ncbi:MAG: M14 family metallocarboxypeptidase [Oscillospiraceae bacterium]|nr:M14 family metallocarboxypeptidase [Oscillospiraceae bacterium]